MLYESKSWSPDERVRTQQRKKELESDKLANAISIQKRAQQSKMQWPASVNDGDAGRRQYQRFLMLSPFTDSSLPSIFSRCRGPNKPSLARLGRGLTGAGLGADDGVRTAKKSHNPFSGVPPPVEASQ